MSIKDKGAVDNNRKIRVLSLFSGCGGMDLGFEGGFKALEESINESMFSDIIKERLNNGYVELKETIFETVFANDILESAKLAYENYFLKRNSDVNFINSSIVDLVERHKKGEKIFPDNIGIVTGGFPCQDFSIAGKRKGFESHKDHNGKLIVEEENEIDEATVKSRGQLYMWMKQVIEIVKPNIFIAENVKGLVNLNNVKEIIQNDFSNADGNGYIVLEPQVLHSANYGVSQSRERVIFIGIKKSALKKSALQALQSKVIDEKYNPYPKPTHNYNIKGEGLKPFVKLESIFKNLVEPEFSNDLSQQIYSKAKFMGKHCQGQIEVRLNNIAPTIRAEHHGNIEFRRLSKENGGKYNEELKSGLVERRLTVRECALIQSFPPDYDFVIKPEQGGRKKFLVSSSQAYKIIGNAVPPLLAYNLALRIQDLWKLYFKK